MNLDLSDFFTTKAEAINFTSKLSTISQQVYATNFNLESALTDQFGLQKKDKFMSLLRNNEVKTESNTGLQDFFKGIGEQIASLPVATLTLAFEPDETVLHNLSQWFYQNINKQILFEIQIDPDLIAGVTILYNGKSQDFSVRQKFNQIVSDVLSSKNTRPALGRS
jgi:F0F1-type ATP synthase delta subunit